MDYLSVDEAMQVVFCKHLPLSHAQTGRIQQLCMALLLAGDVSLTKLARQLKRGGTQDSRVRWIQRLLDAPYMSWERIYFPLLYQALAGFRDPIWHLVMDRSHLNELHEDLVTIALSYRGRAIPLLWKRVPYGGANAKTYCALVQQLAHCFPCLGAVQIVFHADTEFGSQAMIHTLQALHWDFCLAFVSTTHFRFHSQDVLSQALSTLSVRPSKSLRLTNISLFARRPVPGLNLLAFYAKQQIGKHVKREMLYLVTSLPSSPALRRLGRRRWGIEPFHRDLKSSGWQLDTSALSPSRFDGLLLMVATAYLWTVSFGRWLCKGGSRHLVDAKRHRHLSLFRIGWDWLVYTVRQHQPCPAFLRLYS